MTDWGRRFSRAVCPPENLHVRERQQPPEAQQGCKGANRMQVLVAGIGLPMRGGSRAARDHNTGAEAGSVRATDRTATRCISSVTGHKTPYSPRCTRRDQLAQVRALREGREPGAAADGSARFLRLEQSAGGPQNDPPLPATGGGATTSRCSRIFLQPILSSREAPDPVSFSTRDGAAASSALR